MLQAAVDRFGWTVATTHGVPTAPEPTRVYGPTCEGEQICHIVTEDDPDTALCGKDVTGWPWNPPWPYCVVCLDLAVGPDH